jgi:hypothetical protein
MRAIKSKHFVLIGDAIFGWVKLHRLLECTEVLVTLRGLRGHALKADWTMLDPIMILQVDCLVIQ